MLIAPRLSQFAGTLHDGSVPAEVARRDSPQERPGLFRDITQCNGIPFRRDSREKGGQARMARGRIEQIVMSA